MNIDEKGLKRIAENLETIHENIIKINELTGTTKRVNAMRKEIGELGWSSIMSKYHPLNNKNDAARYELFEMYKYVYADMKKKGEVI
jgi:hypothetical protein